LISITLNDWGVVFEYLALLPFMTEVILENLGFQTVMP